MIRLKDVFRVFLKSIIKFLFLFNIGARVINLIGSMIIHNVKIIEFEGIKLRFHVVNYLTNWRVETFSTKEPETLRWIKNFKEDSVFWDVGANIGLYTCYASVTRNCTVVAFEPSVFNLQLLAQNISINGIGNQATICPMPLSNDLSVNKLRFTNIHWGGALSTFKEHFGWDGKELDSEFEYLIPCFTLDEFLKLYDLPSPNYLKIDVDGIEHLILHGGSQVLRGVSELLIEVNDSFAVQRNQCEAILMEKGFRLQEKIHSDIIENSEGFNRTFNQIWINDAS